MSGNHYLLIIVSYLLVILSLGLYFFLKDGKSPMKYMVGDRNFSGGVLGLSLYSSYVSNIALIALPVLAFSSDWRYLVTFIWAPISVLLTAKYVIPLFRERQIVSAYEVLSERLGDTA